ncbi:DUF4232 domain-containing protein [Luteimicrobium sp. DT211]|uniref:DUF4232 domain-containing protein n=1 Tax=Luteimicrobium sp. DT211 TaxID=3393412 RepID=UPI003CFB43BA
MTRRHTPRVPHVGRTVTGGVALVVVGLLTAGTLAACSGGDDADAPAATAATTPGEPSTPASTGGSDATSTPSPSPSSGSTQAGGSSPSPSPSSLRVARCTADHLTGTLTAGDGGGAGSTFPYLVLKNTGGSPCQLQGWPGVSFVGGDDGTQLGAAATLDRSSPHATVTLLPNGHAHAPLKIGQAANYSASTCKPAKADGLRVYVPGETHAIFVKASGLTACTSSKVQLLQTQAIQPGAG